MPRKMSQIRADAAIEIRSMMIAREIARGDDEATRYLMAQYKIDGYLLSLSTLLGCKIANEIESVGVEKFQAWKFGREGDLSPSSSSR